jgi:hypothetical protein
MAARDTLIVDIQNFELRTIVSSCINCAAAFRG